MNETGTAGDTPPEHAKTARAGDPGGCATQTREHLLATGNCLLATLLFWRFQTHEFHHHLQIFPGFFLLARIAQQERRMVGHG